MLKTWSNCNSLKMSLLNCFTVVFLSKIYRKSKIRCLKLRISIKRTLFGDLDGVHFRDGCIIENDVSVGYLISSRVFETCKVASGQNLANNFQKKPQSFKPK